MRARPAPHAPHQHQYFLTFFLLFAALKLNVFSPKLRMYAYVLMFYAFVACLVVGFFPVAPAQSQPATSISQTVYDAAAAANKNQRRVCSSSCVQKLIWPNRDFFVADSITGTCVPCPAHKPTSERPSVSQQKIN